jgi:hypothetical protein
MLRRRSLVRMSVGKMRRAHIKKALHSVCVRCYSASRFTEKAEVTCAADSQCCEPMIATKEITNEPTRNEAAALGFDSFFQPSQKCSDLELMLRS